MSATQPEPNPFSREGSEPGDGLGSEPNRFDTRADGSTPLSQPTSNQPSDGPPTAADPPPAVSSAPDAPDAGSPDTAGFPLYGSAHSSGYADPEPDDEAYAAFRGYQERNQNYPPPGVHHYRDYPTYPGYLQPGPYGPYAGLRPRPPNSPYAVPSLVLGIVGVFCGITGPVGLGLGIAALRQVDAEPRLYGGRGLAIGGIVLGAIGTLWMLLFILGALA